MQNTNAILIASSDEAYVVGLIQLLNRHFNFPTIHARSEAEILQHLPEASFIVLDTTTVLNYLHLSSLAHSHALLVLHENKEQFLDSPGISYLPKSVARHSLLVALTQFLNAQKVIPAVEQLTFPPLSAKERMVLEQLCAGYSLREIAAILELTPTRSKVYRQSLLSKLQARNMANLVYRYFKEYFLEKEHN